MAKLLAIRNKYVVEIKNAKYKYISDQLNFSDNQKDMWTKIKTLAMREINIVIKSVIFANIEYKNNCQVASYFNNYFVCSIREIDKRINFTSAIF